MRLTEAKTRILGTHLGEGQINLIYPERAPLTAKFALVGEDGQALGYYEKCGEWSEKTMEALQALAECMEQDALAVIFILSETTEPAEKTVEPPQF